MEWYVSTKREKATKGEAGHLPSTKFRHTISNLSVLLLRSVVICVWQEWCVGELSYWDWYLCWQSWLYILFRDASSKANRAWIREPKSPHGHSEHIQNGMFQGAEQTACFLGTFQGRPEVSSRWVGVNDIESTLVWRSCSNRLTELHTKLQGDLLKWRQLDVLGRILLSCDYQKFEKCLQEDNWP